MGRKGAMVRISAGHSRLGISQSHPQEWYPRIDLSLSSLRFASNADDLNSQLNIHMHLSCPFLSFACYGQGLKRWRQCLFPWFWSKMVSTFISFHQALSNGPRVLVETKIQRKRFGSLHRLHHRDQTPGNQVSSFSWGLVLTGMCVLVSCPRCLPWKWSACF